MNECQGIVYLVGAGPGDPGLITARGLDLIRRADVIVHDRNIGYELLADARADAVVVDAGKKPGEYREKQAELNQLIVEHARAGAMVVRLKGGDPFIFGRGYEEMTACREAGVDCVVIPGVTSAYAVPAVAGVPITSRHLVRSVAVVTARAAHDSTAPPLDFAALARIDTVCILMGRSNVAEMTQQLIDAGRSGDTPVACIEWGTTPRQRVVRATLATMAEVSDESGLRAPVVIVVGEASRLAREDFNRIATPLFGRTVFVPHSLRPEHDLRSHLAAEGAAVLACPLVDVNGANDYGDLDRALTEIEDYDWVVFASPHAVKFFFKRLLQSGRDARTLAMCRIAAFGNATRRALRRRGVRADVASHETPQPLLAEDMEQLLSLQNAAVLLPCSEKEDSATGCLLRRAGARVTFAACYRRVERALPRALRDRFQDGVDAAILTDADSVRRFLSAIPHAASTPLVCTNGDAVNQARSLGLTIGAVAATNRAQDLLTAVRTAFASAGDSGRPGLPSSVSREVP